LSKRNFYEIAENLSFYMKSAFFIESLRAFASGSYRAIEFSGWKAKQAAIL
jgi:hypothetical protein